jgi:hypothetical protein
MIFGVANLHARKLKILQFSIERALLLEVFLLSCQHSYRSSDLLPSAKPRIPLDLLVFYKRGSGTYPWQPAVS